eukprot:11286363-Alexandrium_andersonii.AAC.1
MHPGLSEGWHIAHAWQKCMQGRGGGRTSRRCVPGGVKGAQRAAARNVFPARQATGGAIVLFLHLREPQHRGSCRASPRSPGRARGRLPPRTRASPPTAPKGGGSGKKAGGTGRSSKKQKVAGEVPGPEVSWRPPPWWMVDSPDLDLSGESYESPSAIFAPASAGVGSSSSATGGLDAPAASTTSATHDEGVPMSAAAPPPGASSAPATSTGEPTHDARVPTTPPVSPRGAVPAHAEGGATDSGDEEDSAYAETVQKSPSSDFVAALVNSSDTFINLTS